jgi:hypothetical protein
LPARYAVEGSGRTDLRKGGGALGISRGKTGKLSQDRIVSVVRCMTRREGLKSIASALCAHLAPAAGLFLRLDVLTLPLLLAVTATERLACPPMAMWSNGDVMEVLKEEWQLSPETVGCD